MRSSAKLLRTSTFRLSAIYLIFFAASVGTLLGYVYWNTAILLERQVDETVQAEVQALADQYRDRGLTGIIETIHRRSRQDTGSVYLLFDPSEGAIAGNLTGMPAEAAEGETEWIEFPLDVTRGGTVKRHVARAFHVNLTGGYRLIVGRDIEAPRQFAGIIRTSIIWALALALLLGLGGGVLISRSFLHRIDAITAASRSIMGGDMARRMPVTGTGDELDRLATALNEMLDRISRLMTGMQEVSSNVAHDLRTPLTRIKARVEAALRGSSAEEYREALEKTVEESDQLLKTFNALLSIARAEAGQSAAGLSRIDAGTVIADVAELYAPIAEEGGGRLTMSVAGEIPVMADRQLLSQAIGNLIDNALKYGTAENGGPEIAVAAAVADGQAVITIADRGPGIAAADRGRVTERFVRLDSSRSKPGNGLGLSLVAGVMKLHG
ncbi:MAG: HAMP domain-containing protein, partial [Alphaproteobacteria bacterium]|nr:HAMP domain-containing protein [Alphaproteobacteria bacterium]